MSTKEQELAEKTLDSLNALCFNDQAYAAVVARTHPTLQQSWMRMAMAVIAELAKKDDAGMYDDRNEASVKFAKKIIELTGDDALPFI